VTHQAIHPYTSKEAHPSRWASICGQACSEEAYQFPSSYFAQKKTIPVRKPWGRTGASPACGVALQSAKQAGPY